MFWRRTRKVDVSALTFYADNNKVKIEAYITNYRVQQPKTDLNNKSKQTLGVKWSTMTKVQTGNELWEAT